MTLNQNPNNVKWTLVLGKNCLLKHMLVFQYYENIRLKKRHLFELK